jgi:hypothetical protein
MSLDKVKSLVWADYFIYTLTDPRELYRLIKSGNGGILLISFSVPALVVIADILALSILGEATGFFYYRLSYGWILVFIYTLVKIAVYSSLIDTVSQFMGYPGRIKELLAVVGFSLFPKVFILPAVYFFSLIGFAPGFFYVFIAFLLFVWHVLVLIQGISEMHSIDFGKAFAVYIIPGIVTGLALFFMLVVIVIAGTGLIFG